VVFSGGRFSWKALAHAPRPVLAPTLLNDPFLEAHASAASVFWEATWTPTKNPIHRRGDEAGSKGGGALTCTTSAIKASHKARAMSLR
jgi:hypothetical protein